LKIRTWWGYSFAVQLDVDGRTPAAADHRFARLDAAELTIELATYVARRTMLRTALSAKVNLAACGLTAVSGEGGVSDRRTSAQHIFGWFDIATVALRSDHLVDRLG
jgi:hypothetical protein